MWKFLQFIFENTYLEIIGNDNFVKKKNVCFALVKEFVELRGLCVSCMQSAGRIHRALSKSLNEKSRHAVIKEEPD